MTTHTKLVHAVTAHGLTNAEDIVVAAHSRGCPLSVACAMVTMESNGRNVWGHDPTSSIPPSWKGGKVTRLRHLFYKVRRGRYGAQGEGPGQLTSPGLQDAADRLGGCWKPLHNLEVAFSYLVSLEREFGSWRLAFQHFNGSGPAAVAYGKRAEELITWFHKSFVDALR